MREREANLKASLALVPPFSHLLVNPSNATSLLTVQERIHLICHEIQHHLISYAHVDSGHEKYGDASSMKRAPSRVYKPGIECESPWP